MGNGQDFRQIIQDLETLLGQLHTQRARLDGQIETTEERLESAKQIVKDFETLLAQLQAQGARLDVQIETAEEQIDNARRFQASIEASEQARASDVVIQEKYDGMSMTNAAFVFLSEMGHDMHVRSIWEELAKHSFTSSAKQPVWMLSTLLAQDERFERVEPGVFKVREVQYPSLRSRASIPVYDYMIRERQRVRNAEPKGTDKP